MPTWHTISDDIVPFTLVGKLLLKSSGVTLLPLQVKETTYFLSITTFPFIGSVTVTSYYFFKCNEIATSYNKKYLAT
jgi:hypothetical protein